MAQLVKFLTLAQVMISQFVGSSPLSGSVLKPASDFVSPSLSASLLLALCLSKINKHVKRKKKKKERGWVLNSEEMGCIGRSD